MGIRQAGREARKEMILLRDLRIDPGEDLSALTTAAAKKLHIPTEAVTESKIIKRSLDARKKNDIHYVISAAVAVKGDEEKLLRKYESPSVSRYEEPEMPLYRRMELKGRRPVIAGFGPGGMFAALALARSGFRPIVLERGPAVEKRQQDVEKFRNTGVFSPESNAQFGEGGAGTFSDGKLNTGTHDRHIPFVLRAFYEHGVDESVLYDAKPHIGTDILTGIVKRIREEIISLGGEVRFDTCLEGLILDGNAICGVTVKDADGRYDLPCDRVILAIGHSARDTFENLHRQNVPMERKAFSMGARIEHLQSRINEAQYGRNAPKGLPAADYSLSVHLPDGSSAYTFCMCPGGYVFAAASEEGGVCTNGMSYSGRDGVNANAALLVTLQPEEFPGEGVLAGMYWQREIERRAYERGSSAGAYFAPAQLVGDFLAGRASTGAGEVEPMYKPGVAWGNLNDVLPEKICNVMKNAIPELDRKLSGFASPDAVLTAPETRSSSPVRILRGKDMQSEIKGLYPCGEGAGYAGGITSAAVDGLRCAEAVIASCIEAGECE